VCNHSGKDKFPKDRNSTHTRGANSRRSSGHVVTREKSVWLGGGKKGSLPSPSTSFKEPRTKNESKYFADVYYAAKQGPCPKTKKDQGY